MTKFEALFEDDNDIFSGTPKSKFWDILHQANKDIVQDELDKMISKFAIMEKLIDDKDLENKIARFELENSIELEEYKKSLYIGLTKNIVAKLEG